MTSVFLNTLDLKTDYRTDRDDAVREFYAPCLGAAKKYSRAVGYFRSSIFVLTGESTINFVRNGGLINLICSPSITKEDMNAIEQGQKNLETVSLDCIQSEIDNLLLKSDEDYSVVLLATLIKVGALRVKIALRKDGSGIYHEKLGIFEDDGGQCVTFIGSSNETLNAWHSRGNFESIEVFCSWNGLRELSRVQRHQKDFSDLWAGVSKGIETIDFPSALKNQLISVAEKDIEDIYLKKYLKTVSNQPKLKINDLSPHQANAITEWEKGGFKGILKHATGSGKTVTALSAIYKHVSQGFPALVLVPSKLLLSQWIKEIALEIPDALVVAAGAGNNAWKKNNMLKTVLYGTTPQEKRIVVATMQTSSTIEFMGQVRFTKNLLLVVDECHQLGSPKNSKFMEIETEKRLGLSATPERYGDSEGTDKLFDFLGEIVLPEITLYDAIQAKRLVEYEYFPTILNLSAIEAEEWKIISKEIKKEIAIASSGEKRITLSNKAKMLLIQRARIAKKSSIKINLAMKVITKNYLSGESWLVYCEDQEQLKQIVNSLRDLGYSPLEYYSSMDGSSVETLKLFQMQGGILVSIRCLDEGVDIPTISHALVLASSQNPRQFIQRRGRVLRRHSSKVFAKIFDAIVMPTSLDDEPEKYSLMKSELTRAYEFASHALNLSAGEELKLAASKLGMDLTEIVNAGYEDEDENENED